MNASLVYPATFASTSFPPNTSSIFGYELDDAVTVNDAGGKEVEANVAGYTKLAFIVFAWGYLLLLIGSSSYSLSTGSCTDKDVMNLGVEI